MAGRYETVMEDRKKLVEKIIENMKQGYVLPKPDWDRGAFPNLRIQNPVSGARYRGGNFVRLYLAGIERGYKDNRWVTYTQAREQGWQVRKGETGVKCEKYIFEKIEEEYNPETGQTERKKIRLDKPIINQFVLFNAEQIQGIPKQELKPPEPMKEDDITRMADMFRNSSECPIRETEEGRAYYSPARDEIILPIRDAFLDSRSFLATQLHEMIHSTGHESRLNRSLQNSFGTVEYAKEELRAELGSFFMETDLEISLDAQHFNSHTQYLQSWIEVLENDPNELFRAMSDAQKATDYLMERYELLQEEFLAVAKEQEDRFCLSKAEEAAVRMAVKRDMKQAGRGMNYLEEWIENDMNKREEMNLPDNQSYDDMRVEYEQLSWVQQLGQMETVMDTADADRMTKWLESHGMYEAKEGITDRQIESSLQVMNESITGQDLLRQADQLLEQAETQAAVLGR